MVHLERDCYCLALFGSKLLCLFKTCKILIDLVEFSAGAADIDLDNFFSGFLSCVGDLDGHAYSFVFKNNRSCFRLECSVGKTIAERKQRLDSD